MKNYSALLRLKAYGLIEEIKYGFFFRVAFLTLAILWMLLGVNSGDVGNINDSAWVTICGAVSLTALIVCVDLTKRMLYVHWLAAGIVAGIRSWAYITDNLYNPLYVWLITVIYALLASVLLAKRIKTDDDDTQRS